MIAAAVGLVLPIAAVWLALRALRLRPAVDSRLTMAAVACCVGIGLSSLTTFIAVSWRAFPGGAFVAVDAALWLVIGGVGWWAARRSAVPIAADPVEARALSPADWLARAAFLVVVTAAFSVPVIEYLAAPHGQWDAWAIWNQKARFFYRAGDGWTASMTIPWSAPGHPVMVSLSVARLWAYAGAELTFVPALLAGVYGATVLAAVMGTLNVGRTRAWVAGSILAAPFAFSHLVAAQTADLPFSMLVVTSLAMLRQDDPRVWLNPVRARSALLLAGLVASLSAWTKNEGALFLVASACLVAWIVLRHGRARDVGWWLVGATPTLAVLAWFKLAVATTPPVYVTGPGSSPLEQLFSPQRHAQVVELVAPSWMGWGGPLAAWSLPIVMCAAVGLCLTPVGRSGRGVLAVVAMMLAGYYLVYVLTPLDVTWLVATTYERLIMQVWPALILAALSVGEPAVAALPRSLGGGS